VNAARPLAEEANRVADEAGRRYWHEIAKVEGRAMPSHPAGYSSRSA